MYCVIICVSSVFFNRFKWKFVKDVKCISVFSFLLSVKQRVYYLRMYILFNYSSKPDDVIKFFPAVNIQFIQHRLFCIFICLIRINYESYHTVLGNLNNDQVLTFFFCFCHVKLISRYRETKMQETLNVTK